MFSSKQLSFRGNSRIQFNHVKANKQSKADILMKLTKNLVIIASCLWTRYWINLCVNIRIKCKGIRIKCEVPLRANVIAECPRTSIQIFSYKFFCTNLSKVKLEILWNSSPIFRSSHQRCTIKKLFLKVLQYSQKNTSVAVSFRLVWSLEKVCKRKWNFISRSLLINKNNYQHPTKYWLGWEGI